jgi:hypothetical protein
VHGLIFGPVIQKTSKSLFLLLWLNNYTFISCVIVRVHPRTRLLPPHVTEPLMLDIRCLIPQVSLVENGNVGVFSLEGFSEFFRDALCEVSLFRIDIGYNASDTFPAFTSSKCG